MLHRSPDRLTLNLTTFYPTDHPQVENIAALTTEDGCPLFAEVEKGLLLVGRLRAGVISQKMAEDWGLAVGDTAIAALITQHWRFTQPGI